MTTKRPVLSAIRNAAAVTLLVRSFGVAGQALLIARYGAGQELDALVLSLVVPGLLVTPLAAALESVVSPRYAAALKLDEASANRSARRLVFVIACAAVVAAAVAVASAPLLLAATAPGLDDASSRIAADVAPIIYASLAPQAVTAALAAISFGRGQLKGPVIAGAVNPLATIVLLLVSVPSIRTVAFVVLGTYLIETLALGVWLGTQRSHADLSGPRQSGSLEPGDLMTGMRPTLLAYGFQRLVPVVDQIFLSTLEPGNITRFALALRLYEVGASMLLLPNARLAGTRLGAASNEGPPAVLRQFSGEVPRALKAGAAAASAIALGSPVLLFLVFGHGRFDTSDVVSTSSLALIFALALLPLSIYYLIPRTFALLGAGDWTVILLLGEATINAVLNLLFVPFLGASGVALSTALSVLIVTYVGVRRISARRNA